MAFFATGLHEHGAQMAQMRLPVEVGNGPDFARLAVRESFQLRLLPRIWRVVRIKILQSGYPAPDAVILCVVIHDLLQHRSRIEQGQRLPVGGKHIAPRHVAQPGYGFLGFGNGHIDTAMLAGPTTKSKILVQVGPRLGVGPIHRLTLRILHVPVKRTTHDQRPDHSSQPVENGDQTLPVRRIGHGEARQMRQSDKTAQSFAARHFAHSGGAMETTPCKKQLNLLRYLSRRSTKVTRHWFPHSTYFIGDGKIDEQPPQGASACFQSTA